MQASTQANLGQFFLLLLLFVAFFPNLFHYLWVLPLALFFPNSATSSPAHGPAASTTAGAATIETDTMSWFQNTFALPSRSRGSYLITDHVVKELPEIRSYKVGLLHLFVQHTSCALSMNENWDSDVRTDMSDALDRIAPDAGPKGEELYLHSAEGPDDMPVRNRPDRSVYSDRPVKLAKNYSSLFARPISRAPWSVPASRYPSKMANW